MKWTKEQQKAIDLRNKNILVAAAAGSGKTSVFVERIRKMVCEENEPIRSFLVVTFTNMAAAEMKERLRASLRNELDAAGRIEDESLRKERVRYIRKQLVDLESASISTFHSFGLSVIRRFFYLLDIEPGFSTADETEIAIMKEEALDTLLEEEFTTCHKDFIDFMDAYSGDRNNFAIRKLILDAYRKMISMPHVYEWMEDSIEALKRLNDSSFDNPIIKLVYNDILTNLDAARRAYDAAVSILYDNNLPYLAEKLEQNEYARCCDAIKLIEVKPGLESGDTIEALNKVATILSEPGSRLTALKEDKPVYEEIKNRVQDYREEAKAAIERINKSYFTPDFNTLVLLTEDTAPNLKTLLRLVKEFDFIYKNLKKESNVIDFDDIEHYALEVLEKDDISDYYRNTVKHIFIDEYQDTNLMQEAIIRRIKGERNLFMVGDIKQSIYRFRLAEPSIFQEKYSDFSSGTNPDNVAIDLNENHRSKAPVIDYINKVFRPIMDGYDERAELNSGMTFKDGYNGELDMIPELKVIISETEDDDAVDMEPAYDSTPSYPLDEEEENPIDFDPDDLNALEKEGYYIANLIRDQIGKPFYDNKMNPPGIRTITPSDIVILRRSVIGCEETYGEILKKYGIASHVEGDDGYFDTMEISGFMDLIRVIDNIRRDVSLIGALHSEVFDFSAEELARIRIAHKEGSFSDAFLSLALDGSEDSSGDSPYDVSEKVKWAYEKIVLWREMSRTMALSAFLWKLLIESGYYSIMGALPQGDQRQANLRMLCDMAERYSSGRQGTLYDFLRYVDSIKRGKIKMAESKNDLSGKGANDSVRIMTVHKSKGLEFPMVILSGVGKSLRMSKAEIFDLHKDIGVGIRKVDRDNNWSCDTLMQTLIKNKKNQEELEEEIRILYVALTRARDKLFLVAHQKNDKFINKAEMGVYDYSGFLGMVAPSVPYEILPLDEVLSNVGVAAGESLGAGSEDREMDSFDPEELYRVLNYKYPHESARSLKSKYSVSELNREAKEARERRIAITEMGDDEIVSSSIAEDKRHKGDSKPRDNTFTAAERGTIYHKVLEHIKFRTLNDLKDSDLENAILEKCHEMIDAGILSEEEFKVLSLSKIRDFFTSPIGMRAIASDSKGMLNKEQPFTLRVDKETYDGNQESILVQGIIDCYFREEPVGGEPRTILVDYKTNWIDPGKPFEEEEERLRNDYKAQLEIYKKALNAAGNAPVQEAYLYLLENAHLISM